MILFFSQLYSVMNYRNNNYIMDELKDAIFNQINRVFGKTCVRTIPMKVYIWYFKRNYELIKIFKILLLFDSNFPYINSFILNMVIESLQCRHPQNSIFY